MPLLTTESIQECLHRLAPYYFDYRVLVSAHYEGEMVCGELMEVNDTSISVLDTDDEPRRLIINGIRSFSYNHSGSLPQTVAA